MQPERASGDSPIDTQHILDDYARYRDTVDDPRRRSLLDVHLAHMTAEIVDRDVDAVMSTMVEHPEFWFYGTEGMASFKGQDATRAFYTNIFEVPENAVGMEMEHIDVGDDSIVIECFVLMSGDHATIAFPDIARVLERGRPALLRKRACLVIPFINGKMAGETHYFDGPYGPDDVVYLDRH